MESVLQKLSDLNVQVSIADEDRLRVRYLTRNQDDPIVRSLVGELKQKKSEILQLLKGQVTAFDAHPMGYWANLKLDLWEKHGSRLFLDEALNGELQRWSFASQAVVYYLRQGAKQ